MDQEKIEFTLKPRVCLLRHKDSSCTDTLDIRWQSAKSYALCLYREDQQEALYCWSSRQEGEWQLAADIRTTTLFVLRDSTNQKQLASQEFSVLVRNKHEPRRNPWSFF